MKRTRVHVLWQPPILVSWWAVEAWKVKSYSTAHFHQSSFTFLLSSLLIPWVIQHLMPGDSMCNFVSQSLLSLPHAMHSQKPWEHTGPLAKMAQLPSQGVRESGRKVCSRSWLPLLAGSAAILNEILALQKIGVCLLPMHTWNRKEELSCDEILV